ncbi:MAG: hypothetical protein JO107_01185, partial [Hyphomicrobiales bacterium]|nr:hypothetical protein [Hyphomicrobiales bacterium]MBV8661691.1 hypothetical protein [Hyphomicrobiales bacterium]
EAHAVLAVARAPTGRDPARDEGVYRFGPFANVSEIVDTQFLPDFAQDGYLWLGVRNLNPSRVVSLFFHIEARANDAVLTTSDEADAERTAPTLSLRYFSDQAWKDLPAAGVIRDTTEQLSRPGLMTLAIPVDARGAPAPSTEELTWLQLAVTQPELYGRIFDLQCGAATATRVGGPPANAGSPILPPNAIIGLTPKQPNVILVGQTFTTENGRLAEDERQFQIRVSERLRHKQRAILPRDYESLILEKFPNIGDARCLTRKEANLYGAPRGQVVIVVAPLRAPGAASLEPRVPEYMLRDIGDYLLQKCPASVDAIVVRNPDYEPLRVSAWLDCEAGDRTAIMRQARDAIDRLIAPWRDDPNAPLPIGSGSVGLADVLGALTSVDRKLEVHGLSLVHFYRDAKPLTPRAVAASPFRRLRDTARPGFGNNQSTPWWPWSVLIPAADPQLQWLDRGDGIGELGVEVDFALAWNSQTFYKSPVQAGIGNLKIDADFLVEAGVGNLAIEDDFCVS